MRKNLAKSIGALNLVYYEFDRSSNAFLLDSNSNNKDAVYEELISITHLLSRKSVGFYIDDDKSIVLYQDGTVFSRLKRKCLLLLESVKNSSLNIYTLGNKKTKWAKNLPMIETVTTPKEIDFSLYDALIFTSGNAITSLDSFDSSWKKIPVYTIAAQSAKTAKELGANVRFVGKKKHGDEFAYELVDELRGKKALYIRGSKTVSSITEILNSAGVECDEEIVYESRCIKYDKEIKLPKNSIIIFSSPSTIECFLKNVKWQDSFKAISIGNTTLKHFPPEIKAVVSDNTSIEACVRKAIEISKA